MPSPVHDTPLAGLRVWVTRPAHQARSLAERIERAGGTALTIPLLRIEPVAHCAQQPLFDAPGGYAFIFFVSPNAVTAAAPHLQAAGGLPGAVTVGVVGQGTARAVRETYGREPDLIPDGQYDSEGLLALPALQQLKDQAVLIVRGDGGREKLADTLRARGARVDYATVYRRRLAQVDLVSGLGPRPDIVVITSSEALRHLADLAERQQQAWVFEQTLVVFHERIRATARALGFQGDIRVCEKADDAGVVDALTAWVQYTGSGSKEDRQ